MDSILDEYMKKKYGDDYQANAESDYKERQGNINSGSIMSSLGAALAGRDPNTSNDYYNQLNKQAKENTIGKIENDRNQFVKNQTDNANLKDIITKNEMDMAQKDPNARQSILARALAKKYNMPVQDTDSYKDVSQFMDPKKMMETEAASNVDFAKQKQLRQMDQSFKKEENALSRANDIEKIQAKMEIDALKKKDPKSLNSTDKARLDNALMVLKGIDDMGSALDKGVNTFSMIGDNPYTQAERRATEGYGRMQSGGTINKEEEANFSKTLPKSLDNKELQRKKLLDQRAEMISRMKTLGFDPADLGYSPKDFKYGSGAKEKTVVNRLINKNTGQTKVVYSDGSEEIINTAVAGRQ